MTTPSPSASTTRRAALVRAALATASLLVAAACGQTTEPEDPFSDAPYEVVACDALQLPASANPVERVSIGSLPSSFSGEVFARVETSDPAVVGYAVVTVDGTAAELLAPLHPSGARAGGEVTLWITDGSRTCAPATMTLQSIPASPGELSAIVEVMQDIVDEQASTLELTRSDLMNTALSDQPSSALPLAIVQRVLDHPDNPASLRAVAEGTSSDVSADQLELIDALLGSAGIRAALEPALPAAMSMSGSAGPVRVSALQCMPDAVESAERLDECMQAAASAAFEVGNAAAEVMADLGTLFTAAALVPQLSVPAGILGLASWVTMTETLRAAALLPSQLTALDYEISPLEFREDESATGSYSSMTLTATNLGWDFGIELLQGLLATAGAASSLDGEELGGLAVDGVVLTLATVPEVGTLLDGSSLETFRREPETFGPVNVTSDDWTTTSVVSGESVVFVSHTDFEPRQPGWTTLTLRTKTGAFTGQSIAEEEQVFVTEVGLTISPDEVVLRPSESETFTVTVTESEHPDSVEIHPEVSLQGEATIASNGDGTHTVTYTAPTTPNGGSTDLLTIRHTARGGARAHAETELTAVATIRFADVQLAPVLECVSPGQDIQIGVTVTGFESQPPLVWTASAGTIDSEGNFTAPDQSGDVTITAAIQGYPATVDSMTVPIGGCTCSFTIQVGSNPPYVGQPGDEVSYYSAEGVVEGAPNVIWAVQMTSAEGPSVILGIPTPEIVAEGPGTYPVDALGGSLGYPGGSYLETNPPQGSLTFFEYTPHSKLTGEAHATVADFEDNEVTYSLDAEFQIYPPADATPWVYSCTIPEEDPS